MLLEHDFSEPNCLGLKLALMPCVIPGCLLFNPHFPHVEDVASNNGIVQYEQNYLSMAYRQWILCELHVIVSLESSSLPGTLENDLVGRRVWAKIVKKHITQLKVCFILNDCILIRKGKDTDNTEGQPCIGAHVHAETWMSEWALGRRRNLLEAEF